MCHTVPSLGLRIGLVCEAGLSAGMRRERVSPQIRKKEKKKTSIYTYYGYMYKFFCLGASRIYATFTFFSFWTPISPKLIKINVINISSSSPAINTAAYYQRCVTTCETVAVVHRQRCLQHLACCSVSTGSQARYRSRIAISAYHTCIRRPI